MILSLSVHECAHAATAYALGDDTAKGENRLTLNPLSHIDMVGTIVLPALLVWTGTGIFGWAKPVPFNPNKFRSSVNPDHGSLMVAAAGPLSNLVLAVVAAITIRVLQWLGMYDGAVAALLEIMLTLNIILAVFNLLPIPPLDGGHILRGLFPARLGKTLTRLEANTFYVPAAFFVIIVLGPVLILWPSQKIEYVLRLLVGIGVG
jgi:Zn-dependent protease